MYTGTMIEDLIRTVEKVENTEQQARTELIASPAPAARFETYPVATSYAYVWAGLEQGIVGVA